MTTLEEIKRRQEQINELLYTLLTDTEVVMGRILGEQPTDNSEMESMPCSSLSGLLQEISYSQDFTANYIEKLSVYDRLLINAIFIPEKHAVKSDY